MLPEFTAYQAGEVYMLIQEQAHFKLPDDSTILKDGRNFFDDSLNLPPSIDLYLCTSVKIIDGKVTYQFRRVSDKKTFTTMDVKSHADAVTEAPGTLVSMDDGRYAYLLSVRLLFLNAAIGWSSMVDIEKYQDKKSIEYRSFKCLCRADVGGCAENFLKPLITDPELLQRTYEKWFQGYLELALDTYGDVSHRQNVSQVGYFPVDIERLSKEYRDQIAEIKQESINHG